MNSVLINSPMNKSISKSIVHLLFPQEFADSLVQFFAYNFIFCPAGDFFGVTAGNFADIICSPG